jgi:hypothetical protein
LEYEDTVQQYPAVDALIERVRAVLTVIDGLAGHAPASVESPKWALIVKTWRTPDEISDSF